MVSAYLKQYLLNFKHTFRLETHNFLIMAVTQIIKKYKIGLYSRTENKDLINILLKSKNCRITNKTKDR